MEIIRIRHLKEYPSINLRFIAHTFRAILKDEKLISYGRICQKRRDEALLLMISDMPADVLAMRLQDYCSFVTVTAY